MRHTPFLIVLALVTAFVTGSCAAGEYKLSVGPVEADLKAAVLEAELPAIASGFAVFLKPAAGGAEVAHQIEPAGEKSRVTWIAMDLKKGDTAEWLLQVLPTKTVKPPPRISVAKKDGAIDVSADGKLFTSLRSGGDSRTPYLWPLLLDGAHLTRHYPQDDAPGEDRDHPHHRSVFFTHGEVGDVDFWAGKGKIRQTEVRAADGGDVFARIATTDEWLAPDGTKILDDGMDLRFYDLGEAGRFLDFSIVLTAARDSVEFGDTKEGTFGVRLAESMKEKRGGRIENSRGAVGMDKAWGKPAEWVDYTGPVGGKTVGVAIFDHPASFRYPTTWHVRDYGLFAANAFAWSDFKDPRKDGTLELAKGKSIVFRYRLFLHPGSTADARVAAVYRAFASPPPVRVTDAKG